MSGYIRMESQLQYPNMGFAFGFDRLTMIFQNERNIREVIAFAKTGKGKGLMTDAPPELS